MGLYAATRIPAPGFEVTAKPVSKCVDGSLKQLLDEVPLLLVSRSRPDLIHVDVPEHRCETRSALS